MPTGSADTDQSVCTPVSYGWPGTATLAEEGVETLGLSTSKDVASTEVDLLIGDFEGIGNMPAHMPVDDVPDRRCLDVALAVAVLDRQVDGFVDLAVEVDRSIVKEAHGP